MALSEETLQGRSLQPFPHSLKDFVKSSAKTR